MRGQQIQNGTIEQVKLNLADPTTNVQAVTKGYGINKYISYNTLTDFRLTNKSELADKVTIGDYLYKYDASDTTSVDNGTTVIRTLDGKRYKKIYFDISTSDLTSINNTINGRIPFGSISNLRTTSSYTAFQVVEKGKEGMFSYDENDTTSLDDGVMTIVQGSKRYKRITTFVTPEMFGAKGDGVTNDTSAFISMFNYLNAYVGSEPDKGLRYSVLLSAPNYKINSSLNNIKWGRYSILGNGSRLDFSSLTSGIAMNIDGQLQPSFSQARVYFEGFEIVGNGKAGTVIGIYLNASSNYATAHSTFENISINNFSIGLSYGQNSYIDTWYSCNMYDCGTCIDRSSSLDSGENHGFIGCSFFNSNKFLNVAADCNMKFIKCSIDYNTIQATFYDGQIFFENCHIEGANHASRQFQILGGSANVTFKDCNIAVTNATTKPDYYWYIEPTTSLYRQFKVIDCFISGLLTSTNEWCGGANGSRSKFIVSGNSFYYQSNVSHITARANNLLSNGDFENSNLNFDNIFIITDGTYSTPSNRFVGSNLNVTSSTTTPFAGTRCLSIEKTSGISTGSTVWIPLPCKANKIYKVSAKHRQVGGTTGAYLFGLKGVTLIPNGTTFSFKENGGMSDYSEVVPTNTWTTINASNLTCSTASADTHIVVTIELFAWGAGTLFLDDIILTEM